ncbi:MAG: M50 family metallopeptidase [Solirubrobacteraceae bacterium]
MSWVLAFAGFAALIILHELGHFAAAKAVGMRVERFSLFFPPLAARIKRGETEYAIGTVPLGGYVKITGMSPREELSPEVLPRAYFRQPVWKRVVVIAAGPAMNLLIAFLIIAVLFTTQGVDTNAVVVGDVQKGTPAAHVLQKGDRVLSVDGVAGYAPGLSQKEITRRQLALRAAISRHTCAGGSTTPGCVATTPATVVVQRDGARLTLRVAPRFDPAAKRMLIGFGYGETRSVSAPQAARYSVQSMWQITRLTVSAITRIFYDSKARKEVSGVVGSYETTRAAINFDTATALRVLALISLSLAVVNLFPFLPLDGGHIFWALAEKLRGRPIPFALIERASVVGFLLVAFLFAVGLSNDIGRLQGSGFQIR